MTAVNIYDMADTWTNGATTYTAIKMNATDTASAAGSLLMDLQVGGTSYFKVSKAGVMTLNDVTFTHSTATLTFSHTGNGYERLSAYSFYDVNAAAALGDVLAGDARLLMGSSAALGWSDNTNVTLGATDLYLYRDAANTLAQRNSTNAQGFRVYNTWTDASNGEWLQAAWSGNLCTIKTSENGTGTHRDLAVVGVATPAGGSTSARLIFGTTAGFGIYYGSGAPSSLTAAQGSIYLRSDGSSTSTRLYVNTDAGTTWTNFTSAA
jgi:hypothetical protein